MCPPTARWVVQTTDRAASLGHKRRLPDSALSPSGGSQTGSPEWQSLAASATKAAHFQLGSRVAQAELPPKR